MNEKINPCKKEYCNCGNNESVCIFNDEINMIELFDTEIPLDFKSSCDNCGCSTEEE